LSFVLTAAAIAASFASTAGFFSVGVLEAGFLEDIEESDVSC
jgi:hypothetical protein